MGDNNRSNLGSQNSTQRAAGSQQPGSQNPGQKNPSVGNQDNKQGQKGTQNPKTSKTDDSSEEE